MIVLAGLCVAIGLTAPLWPLVLRPAVCRLWLGHAASPRDARGDVDPTADRRCLRLF